jgi:hypothetical protein
MRFWVRSRVLGDPARVLRGQGVSMVAEDFSYYGLAGVPSTLALLGIRNESAGAVRLPRCSLTLSCMLRCLPGCCM